MEMAQKRAPWKRNQSNCTIWLAGKESTKNAKNPVKGMIKSRIWHTKIDYSSLSTIKSCRKKHMLPPLDLHVHVLRRVKWSSGRHILAYPQILWKWATIEIETFLIKRHSNWTFLSFLFFKVGRQKLLRHPAVVDSSDGICTHLDLFTNDWTTKSIHIFPQKNG